ncbi:MAG: metallophosphoesterase [Candidatus Thorarchaeota archaeon]
MRIAALSDLHVHPDQGDEFLLQEIHHRVQEISPDVLVIAGDVSSKLDILSDALSKLHIPNAANLFVSGNHDIWFEEKIGLGSLEKYSRYIGDVCRENGFFHLPDAPHIEEDVAFIGSLGWYDYSFRRTDMDIPEHAYEQKEYGGSVWYDVLCVDWEFTDKEATDLFNQKLEYDLSVLPDSVSRVVYVSHHLPFRDLTLYKNRLPWDFFSAFMGAASTGDILLNDGRVVLTISGHSHVRMNKTFDGITSITVPLGYGRPADDEIPELAQATVANIELVDNTVQVHDFVEGDICEGMPYRNAR